MVKAKPPLALIAGPTASGKSALAPALAERANGIIINADSAQLYRDLPILSAAPSPDELDRAGNRGEPFAQHARVLDAAPGVELGGQRRADPSLDRGDEVGPAEAAEMGQRLLDAGRVSERGEQLVAAGAPEARDGQALEHAREAPRGRPGVLAGERRGLGAVAGHPRPVLVGGRVQVLGQPGRQALRPCWGDHRQRLLDLGRVGSDEGEQEREPGRVLGVGGLGDRRVRAGQLEARGSGADRAGQALQGPFTYLMGQGGQVLYLLPEQQLVVYRAGETVQLLHSTLYGAWNSISP